MAEAQEIAAEHLIRQIEPIRLSEPMTDSVRERHEDSVSALRFIAGCLVLIMVAGLIFWGF
jgi:hypothetical protein